MNTTHNATHTFGLSAVHKLNYAAGKLGLIPAFGDSIGKDVNKAELSLARSYVQSAAGSHADLLAALENVSAKLERLCGVSYPDAIAVDLSQARAAIARAKGQA